MTPINSTNGANSTDVIGSLPSVPPRHVAIIMDGNGRWANQRGYSRAEGHKAGARSVRTTVESARRAGIRYLTLFSFSTENWRRSPGEVAALMELFKEYLDSELDTLLQNDIRLRAIGDIERLPLPVRFALNRNIERTRDREGMDLILALSYGGREEIVAAARTLATAVERGELRASEITPERFAGALWTSGIPDPDLLIRTSAELRISNFLLWQLAYTEIVVVPELWPEFEGTTFQRALAEFARRERRFGLAVDRPEALAKA